MSHFAKLQLLFYGCKDTDKFRIWQLYYSFLGVFRKELYLCNVNLKTDIVMETTVRKVKAQKFSTIKRTRKECPENLSKAGRWMQENPNGIAIIVNRRAVNR